MIAAVQPTMDRLTTAARHLEAGRIQDAEQIFQYLLQDAPGDPEAIIGLAAVALARGNAELAFDILSRARALHPSYPGLLAALGSAHRALGRLEDAITCVETAIQIAPRSASYRHALAKLLIEQKRFDDARTQIMTGLDTEPDNPDLLNLHGSLLVGKRQYNDAAVCFGRAAEVAPDRADAVHNLALVLSELGRFDEALTSAERAFLLDPSEPDYRASLVRRQLAVGKTDAALAAGKAAIAIAPRHIACHEAYAMALMMAQQADQAIALLVSLVRQTQSSPEACIALARLLRRAGRLEESLTTITHVRRTEPELMTAALIETDLKLSLGQYPAPEPEAATQSSHAKLFSAHDVPLGDAIFLARFLTEGTVLLCDAGHAAVLSGVAGVRTRIAPAADLPSILGLLPAADLAQEAADPRINYMTFAPALVDPWRQALADLPAPRIGVLWSDATYELPFDQLAHALTGFGTLVSLATGDARAHLHRWPMIMDGGAHIQETIDHAAAISALDFLVTTNSNAAHLAGALGKRGCIIVGSSRPWQWSARDGRSIWYPSLEVVTQSSPGQWDDTIGDIQNRLHRLLGQNRPRQEMQT